MTANQPPHKSKRYRPATEVKWAKLLPHQPVFIKRKKSRGKYAVGVRYERQVQEHLALLALARPNFEYLESPWIEYEDESGKRWCQPDGLIVSSTAIIIAEIKYQHTIDAWWQLVHLYRPVVKVLFPNHRPVCLLEIVHWHDPAVAWPERYDLTDSPLRIPQANKIAVHIFNPSRQHRFAGLSQSGHSGREGSSTAAGEERLEEGTS